MVLAIAAVIAVAAVAALLVQALAVQPNSDAKDALRDARVTVASSFPSGRGVSAHIQDMLTAKSFAADRRKALRDVNRVIGLRKQAVARLGDVPAEADSSYRGMRDTWRRMLRRSLGEARTLRTLTRRLGEADLKPGGVAVYRRSGVLISPKTSRIELHVVGFALTERTLRRTDAILREGNPWIR